MADYFASNTSNSDSEDSLSRRLSGLGTKSTSCYTSSSDCDGGLSLLYTTLPHILQRRIPRIRSLRYAASFYASSKPHLRSWSTSSASSTSSESPPPSYHTRPSTSDSSADDTDQESDDDERPEFFTSAPSSRPSTSGSATPAPNPAFKKPEDNTPTDIGSRSGHHGLALLNIALRSQPTTATNDPLNRRLYIDGISYILRGLPSDLTPEEALVLRAAAPPDLLPPAAPASNETDLALQHQAKNHASQPNNEPASLLHRSISTLTFYTLLIITLALPYLQTLFATLYALDAKHHFSARFLTQTSLLLRLLAAQVLAVAAMAWGANDGALRHACRDFGVWVLRDICGGVDDGVGRAVVGLRLEEREER